VFDCSFQGGMATPPVHNSSQNRIKQRIFRGAIRLDRARRVGCKRRGCGARRCSSSAVRGRAKGLKPSLAFGPEKTPFFSFREKTLCEGLYWRRHLTRCYECHGASVDMLGECWRHSFFRRPAHFVLSHSGQRRKILPYRNRRPS
jgi:hypothetical protein